MSLDGSGLRLLEEALLRLEQGFAHLPATDAADEALPDDVRRAVLAAADRLHDNFPYHHPLYAGQMLKPPHAVARIAYSLALFLNPNNHALDGGRASSAMEKEAVARLAAMAGWDAHLGHLCGGGTMANLEALWVAGRLRPGEAVVASGQAHYTHARIAGDVLGLPFESVPTDERARLDVGALEARLARGGVGTVVATLGTTGVGAVDPLPAIVACARRHGARVHVDAAYGGYFALAGNLAPEARAAFDALGDADSLVIDPHKHGLQPYGCGCVLFRDPSVGTLYRHDSPYTYFTSADLHLGEISLECSRPGAAAVALWATLEAFPLERGGAFARGLEQGREAALALHAHLAGDDRWLTLPRPELDIVVWTPRARTASAAGARARAVFAAAAERNLHLALIALPEALARPHWPDVTFDEPSVTCLRSCLMKPEHRAWLPRIEQILEEALNA